MTTYVGGTVRVTVPATSANLGPGFDCLGLALDLRDELTARVTDAGLTVRVHGEGAEEVPLDESHLVVRAMRAAFAAMGGEPPGLFLSCRNAIPHARGLGSSSAAIVGGVALARALIAGGTLLMDDDALFQLAAELEGHPDNVAPAFFGGFVISGQEDGRFFAARTGVDPRVSAVVFVPPTALSTQTARELLPTTVGLRDAAANSARAALLVAALAGRPELLLLATKDYLHQDYREPAMPESLALMRSLRAEGVPAVVSGAGPTVLAFCDGPGCSPGSAELLLARCPPGWTGHHLSVVGDGVTIG
jgi:homoserine kinase